jgi:hypothetical protein
MTDTERKPVMAVRLLITDAMGEELESRLASMKKSRESS